MSRVIALLAVVPVLAGLASSVAGCAGNQQDDEPADESAGALTRQQDAEWFYDGALPTLTNANITVSLKGSTARVTGYAEGAVDITGLPHVQKFDEGGRTRLEIVYPIATARAGKTNSPPGTYQIQYAKPYRPDGTAFTQQEGEHWVPWGGYPFVAYNDGIAFHGPITYTSPQDQGEDSLWYLQRGPVSGGCNRMMAEHVLELAHLVGFNMRKVYTANREYPPAQSTNVVVLDDYDRLGDKYVDVDYATWSGVTRPGTVYGDGSVSMFGSWVATETQDGHDLPGNMQWQGGVKGKYYVFAEHAKRNVVCSFAKADLDALKTFAASQPNGALPKGICAKKDCVVGALRGGQNAKTTCRL